MKLRKKTENSEYHTETLKRWTPSFMLKIGVILNIIFCTLLSLLVVTLPLTVPAIILNTMLLIPRVDTKRYHAHWKYIPIVLTLFLVAIIWFIVFFTVASLQSLLDSFMAFVNTYILFWTKNERHIDISWWLRIFEITLLSVGTSGSFFILFGWYWGKEIGEVQVKNKPAHMRSDDKSSLEKSNDKKSSKEKKE